MARRWRKVTAKVFPATTPQSTGIEEDDPKEDEHIQEERPSWEPEPELKLRTYPYMIFPLALHKLMWDYLIIALVAYNVLELPMTIAFGSEACDVRFCSTSSFGNVACAKFVASYQLSAQEERVYSSAYSYRRRPSQRRQVLVHLQEK